MQAVGIAETIAGPSGEIAVWRCTVCGHVHGYDRMLCNNCYNCRRPALISESKRRKRPRDVVGNAVHVMKILTGEIKEEPATDDGKDPAAKAMGGKGGKARAASMTAERRAEIARKAAAARWRK